MTISVCMATYNCKRYLPEQITSILAQIAPTDELIVVDDASTDGTLAYLKDLDDPRIRIHSNPANLGHVQSFARVIGLARGNYIMLADQDDIWTEGRLDAMLEVLESGPMLVSTNSEFIDGDGCPIASLHPDLNHYDSNQYAGNIARIFLGKAFYDGCTMGFRAELRELILPIPAYVESHDLWIAMAANVVASNVHLPLVTLRRRVHGSNASVGRRPLLRKLWSRLVFARSLVALIARSRKFS